MQPPHLDTVTAVPCIETTKDMILAKTIFEKIWDSHEVALLESGESLLYIDRHLVNEVTSSQAFEGLRVAGRKVRAPQRTVAVADHNVPTERRDEKIADPESRLQVETLEHNVAEFGVPYIPLRSLAQGIVHVVGPELGLTLPGSTIVCGDSHTSTHGAFGALAFGIGTSEVEHVLATQTLAQLKPKTMRICIEGTLGAGVSAKDIALLIAKQIGSSGANGHVIEYCGSAITALDMAGRMTLCNMSIEFGARAGLIAPDELCIAYLKGRPLSPQGSEFEEARAHWLSLRSDPDAIYDASHAIVVDELEPMVTWGTTPEAASPISGTVPRLESVGADDRRQMQFRRMLDYMDLAPGQPLSGIAIDVVFIGSCTNSRIEDLRAASRIVQGRKVSSNVRALVVPGSGSIKRQAEQEGLDKIFLDAGFEWREAGCSMCLGMNPDRLQPGQRCASTSNRNFEGRQGTGGRTHLVSPVMAAAAALAGHLVDVREYIR